MEYGTAPVSRDAAIEGKFRITDEFPAGFLHSLVHSAYKVQGLWISWDLSLFSVHLELSGLAWVLTLTLTLFALCCNTDDGQFSANDRGLNCSCGKDETD